MLLFQRPEPEVSPHLSCLPTTADQMGSQAPALRSCFHGKEGARPSFGFSHTAGFLPAGKIWLPLAPPHGQPRAKPPLSALHLLVGKQTKKTTPCQADCALYTTSFRSQSLLGRKPWMAQVSWPQNSPPLPHPHPASSFSVWGLKPGTSFLAGPWQAWSCGESRVCGALGL